MSMQSARFLALSTLTASVAFLTTACGSHSSHDAAPAPAEKAVSVGTRLDFAKSQAGETLAKVEYSLQSKTATLSFDVDTDQLSKLVDRNIVQTAVAVYDSSSKTAVTSLKTASLSVDGRTFSVAYTDSDAETFLSHLKSSLVVLSSDNNTTTPAAYADLGALCASEPSAFVNVDTGATGCDLNQGAPVPPSTGKGTPVKTVKLSACENLVVTAAKLDSANLSCLQPKAEFAAVVAQLCHKDGKSGVRHFRAYNEYGVKMAKLEKISTTSKHPSLRRQAVKDMAALEKDWARHGYKSEIDGILSQIEPARKACL